MGSLANRRRSLSRRGSLATVRADQSRPRRDLAIARRRAGQCPLLPSTDSNSGEQMLVESARRCSWLRSRTPPALLAAGRSRRILTSSAPPRRSVDVGGPWGPGHAAGWRGEQVCEVARRPARLLGRSRVRAAARTPARHGWSRAAQVVRDADFFGDLVSRSRCGHGWRRSGAPPPLALEFSALVRVKTHPAAAGLAYRELVSA